MASSTKSTLYLQNAEEVRKVFNRFDTNGDGKISSSELGNVLKALGSTISQEELGRMMEELDTDHNGFISLDEFTEFCKGDVADDGLGSDGGDHELKDAFETYDQDKNGLISASELHLVLTRLGEKCSLEDCLMMIKSVDSDGDGKVSFDEFKKMMTKTMP